MAEIEKKIANFVVADRYAEARLGFEYRDAYIMKSVYSTLFLDKRKSGKFSIFVKNVASSRCLVDMYIPSTVRAKVPTGGVFTHILREASALFARSTKMGNTRASVCRTSNKYGSHAFLYPQIS